jgi:glycosyltransferase involved in cell wall biosynthesis
MTVEITLPVRNARAWVAEAVESVAAQTFTDWRLHVVDDASSDHTLELIRDRFGGLGERIIFRRRETSAGPGAARVRVAGETRGEYLAFIDADDRWKPRKLELQLERFGRDPALDAVHADVEHINRDGALLPGSADRENARRAGVPYERLDRSALLEEMFLRNSIRLVSVLIRRSAYERAGGFDPGLPGGEDWEFWVRFAAVGCRIAHLPVALVERRLHGSNLSGQAFRIQGNRKALKNVLRRFPELAPLAEQRARRLARREKRINPGAIR